MLTTFNWAVVNAEETALAAIRACDTQLALEGMSSIPRRIQTASKFAAMALKTGLVVPVGPEGSTEHILNRWALARLNEEYGGIGNLGTWPSIFVRVFGDVYAVDTLNPYFFQIGSVSLPRRGLLINGLPAHLREKIPPEQLESIIALAQECQLHFARLEYMAESFELAKVALLDMRRAVASALSGFDDYNGSRWHSLHASEKLLKVLLEAMSPERLETKSQQRKRRTHNLKDLAALMLSKTGLRVPSSLLGSLHKTVANTRYRTGSTYELAAKDMTNGLRLASFVFTHLKAQGKVSLDSSSIWLSFPKQFTNQVNDILLFECKYPGIASRRIWQPRLSDVYGRDI